MKAELGEHLPHHARGEDIALAPDAGDDQIVRVARKQ